MDITGRTKVVGVFGHPVGHSLSPPMHNAAFAHLALDFVYIPMEVLPERLPDALRGVIALGMVGVNVTIPHKERTAELMDEITEEARLFGAVNTVIHREGRLLGDNTDGRGFLRPLMAEGFDPRGKRALLFGAGGASRAVAITLARQGAKVIIANRTEARAVELADRVNRVCGAGAAEAIGLDAEPLARITEQADLLVNTTSVGMLGNPRKTLPIPEESLHSGLFVYDLVYNPLRTPLLAAAESRGCRTLGGVKMLVHQGALALETWTGAEAPIEVMEAEVVSRLSSPTD